MKKIIALYGSRNSGKTRTILELIDRLRPIATVVTEATYGDELFSDKAVILKVNGVKIGLVSRGDVDDEIEENLNEFDYSECVIIISTCHTRGTTCDAINTFSTENSYEIGWIEKTKWRNRKIDEFRLDSIDREINLIDANFIYQELMNKLK